MDMLKELRLRRWARENFVSPEERSADWHQVVLDEMRLRDAELAAMLSGGYFGSNLVPLEPTTYFFDVPHLGPTQPHFLSKPQRSAENVDSEWNCHYG